MLRRILPLVLLLGMLPVVGGAARADETPDLRADYTWARRAHDDAIGGSIWIERTQGASATLRFTGTTAVWYTVRGPGYGRARIFLDGELVRSVNNHASEHAFKAPRRVRASRAGEHVLRIVVSGEPGAPGGGRWIAVDGFRVDGAFVPAGRARYRWDLLRTDSGIVRRSSAGGARATYVFSGKGIDTFFASGPDKGRARVWSDGVGDEIDTYAAEAGSLEHDFAGLEEGGHTLVVQVLGSKHGDSTGETVALRGFLVRRPPVRVFRDLGTWVDLWDYDYDETDGSLSPDPETAIAAMAARGVRTLYLQTARYTSDAAFAERGAVGPWIDAAHAAGISVVGWYLPKYANKLAVDVRRTAAIATFRSEADEGFDALAVDIEHVPGGPSGDEFNSGIRTHLRRVRARVGNQFPIGVIIPAPVAMDHLNASYAGFPYASIGRYGDAVLPMGYWSYRTDGQCASDEVYCALGYTYENTVRSRARTGLPVHVIGGIANEVSGAEVDDFVAAAVDAKAAGGSLYDYNTMRNGLWARLAPLNRS
jgi:hypothetical protein